MGLSILLIAITIGLSTSILGVFLVLRQMSMTTDAISHTVLLGIVLAFLLVPSLDSPLLVFGAVLMGLLTTVFTEMLVKSKKVTEDAATGVIFPLLFSIAIIIISLFIKDVHMDIDAVLLGKLELASIDQLVLFGKNIGPKTLYISLGILIINIAFVLIFYKELKLISFDEDFALVIGFMPAIIHFLLMALVSLTAVVSFSSVGSILVVALMIGPAATALQFTKDLKFTIVFTAVIAIINSIIGYYLAITLNVTIAGMISTTTLLTFIVVLLFNYRSGVLFKIIRRNKQKQDFSLLVLLMHINNHQGDHDEIVINNIYNELNWSKNKFNKLLKIGGKFSLIIIENDLLKLTNKGIIYHNDMLKELNI